MRRQSNNGVLVEQVTLLTGDFQQTGSVIIVVIKTECFICILRLNFTSQMFLM